MKNIVLICNSFYEYEKDIVKKIEQNGDKCLYFDSNYPYSIKDRVYKHINKKKLDKKIENYFNNILNCIQECDVLLIIFSPLLTKKFIKKFRKKFSNAKVIYYSWDSVCNFENIKEIAGSADKAYSFDKNDCKKYNFNFLPLFCPEKDYEKKTSQYDYSMIFSLYPKKVVNYKKITNILPSDLNGYTHVFIDRKMYYYYKIFFKEFRKIQKKKLSFETLNKEKVYEIFNSSNVIIDCPLEGQSGLTIRTFEALKMKKRIITTNKDIKTYDFYDEKNIFVVDEETKQIPNSFFKNESEVKYESLEKYSLQNFISELIN